jgi:hypothetical protein
MVGNAGRFNQVYRVNAGDDGAHGSDAPYLVGNAGNGTLHPVAPAARESFNRTARESFQCVQHNPFLKEYT